MTRSKIIFLLKSKFFIIFAQNKKDKKMLQYFYNFKLERILGRDFYFVEGRGDLRSE